MLIFKIEMNAKHRCRIVDVKATGFRGARHVREGRRRRFVRWGGNIHGSLGRHGLSGRYPPRGTAGRSAVQPYIPTTCTHGLWPHACRASGENLRRGRGGGGFGPGDLEPTTRPGKARRAAFLRRSLGGSAVARVLPDLPG